MVSQAMHEKNQSSLFETICLYLVKYPTEFSEIFSPIICSMDTVVYTYGNIKQSFWNDLLFLFWALLLVYTSRNIKQL